MVQMKCMAAVPCHWPSMRPCRKLHVINNHQMQEHVTDMEGKFLRRWIEEVDFSEGGVARYISSIAVH